MPQGLERILPRRRGMSRADRRRMGATSMATGLMVAGRRVVSRLWRRTAERMVEAPTAELPTAPAMAITVRAVTAPAMVTMAGLATVLTVPTTVALATAPTARP